MTNPSKTPAAAQDTIRELMTKYHASRPAWLAHFGNDDGFDAWFTKEVSPTPTIANLTARLDLLAVRYATLEAQHAEQTRKLARATDALRAIAFDPFGPSDIDHAGFIRLSTEFARAMYAELTA